MNPTDTVKLAGYIRAHFPSQPIDEYTADALGELLAPYPAETCKAAVLAIAMRNHEGDTRQKWCSPTDVYAEVRRQRAKRIAEAEPVNLPVSLDPDDTAAYIEALVEARRRDADGEPVDVDPLAALPPRNVVEELGQAGQPMPPRHALTAAREAADLARTQHQAAQPAPLPPLLEDGDLSREAEGGAA